MSTIPFSADAEQGLLSCWMQNPAHIDEALEQGDVTALFHLANHRVIASRLIAMRADNVPVDLVTVSDALESYGELEKAGGRGYIAEVSTALMHTAHHGQYLRTLKDKHLLRRTIQMGTEIIQLATEHGDDAQLAVDRAESLALSIRPLEHTTGGDLLSEGLEQTLSAIEAAMAGTAPQGYSGGFSWLDKITGGLQPEMWFIGARPSVGKTSVALDMIRHLAIAQNIRCGFFSMEMSKRALLLRLLSRLSGVSLHQLKSGTLNQGEMQGVGRASLLLNKAPIFVDERPALTLSQIASKARRWVRNEGVQVLFCDFLQRMGVENAKRNGSRTDEHGQNSRGLTALQKELGVPIVCLAQLNRDCEKRPDLKPKLSDFEGCGGIEQDADVALLLSRPKAQPDDESIGHVLFDVAKNGQGPCGDRLHIFDKEVASFRPHPVIER